MPLSEPPAIIPREVLFGNPEKALPQISPDGKLLASGGGIEGNGCIAHAFSPGMSDAGTLRSSMGHNGLPVSRSKTQTKPCLLTWATASMVLPS